MTLHHTIRLLAWVLALAVVQAMPGSAQPTPPLTARTVTGEFVSADLSARTITYRRGSSETTMPVSDIAYHGMKILKSGDRLTLTIVRNETDGTESVDTVIRRS